MFLFFCSFMLLYLSSFSKKLLILLCLEGMMLILILFLILFYSGGLSVVSSVCLFLVTMMVLDSVVGLSLLVSSSRNSFDFNSFYNMF